MIDIMIGTEFKIQHKILRKSNAIIDNHLTVIGTEFKMQHIANHCHTLCIIVNYDIS